MDLLEEFLSHLGRKVQSIRELNTLLELLGLLGISVYTLHDLLVEELEHYGNHENSSRSCFLQILRDIAETFADSDRCSSVNLT